MTHVISPVIGVSLSTVYTGTTTDGEDAPFALGTRVNGEDGTVWLFVQAEAAVTQYDCVIIDENFQIQAVTTTLATEASGDAGCMFGFAQVAFADNEFGWVATKGSNISCRGSASAGTADMMLYTTATAGVLSTVSAGVLINGVAFVTSASASAAEIIASNPVSRFAVNLAS